MAILTPLPRFIAFTAQGLPLDGGKVYTYAAGTTTPKATYTDQTGNTPNTNPVILDSAGSANIWLNGAYKIDIQNSNGVSLTGYPIDNVVGYNALDWTGLTATIAQLNACDTSTLTKTTTYSVATSDRGKTILADTTSSAFTINLPSVVTATNGFELTIKKVNVSTNLLTIDGNGSETIEGRTTFILYDQNDTVTLLCDGSNWRVKSSVIRGNTVTNTADFTVGIADIGKTFVCNSLSSSGFTVTLPNAATAGDGFRVRFKKTSDTYNITLSPAAGQLIDGQSSFVLNTPWDYVDLLAAPDVSNPTPDTWFWLLESASAISKGAKTGDIKNTFQSTPPAGWINLNDGTIGDATSGATTRANADCADLFALLWGNVANTWAPVFDSSGNPSSRGASAATDFAAHKRLQLPRVVGKAWGVSGTGSFQLTFTADNTTEQLTFAANDIFKTGDVLQVSNVGGALPTGLTAATNYYVIKISSTVIQLASSLANAQASPAVPVTFSDNGTGTQFATITLTTRALGEQVGEEAHSQTVAEIGAHYHTVNSYTPFANADPYIAATQNATSPSANNTSTVGSNTPFNIMQPTVFSNAFIKL